MNAKNLQLNPFYGFDFDGNNKYFKKFLFQKKIRNFYFFKESIRDQFVGFYHNIKSTSGRSVYEGPLDGSYYICPNSKAKKYFPRETIIIES